MLLNATNRRPPYRCAAAPATPLQPTGMQSRHTPTALSLPHQTHTLTRCPITSHVSALVIVFQRAGMCMHVPITRGYARPHIAPKQTVDF